MANRSPSISLRSTGSTVIYTPSFSTLSYIIDSIFVVCTAASGITVPATISIGTNASTFNNILAATALTGVTAANNYLQIPITTGNIIARNTPISVNVTIAATGTSQAVTIYLNGFYG